MMEALHHEELPVNRMMRLIQEGAGHRHLGVCEDRIPAGFLLLKPAPYTLAIGGPCCGGDVVGKVASPLAERKHAQALALACPIQQRVELRAECPTGHCQVNG